MWLTPQHGQDGLGRDVRPVATTAALSGNPAVWAGLWVEAAVEAVGFVAVDLGFADEDDVLAPVELVESELPVTHLCPQR